MNFKPRNRFITTFLFLYILYILFSFCKSEEIGISEAHNKYDNIINKFNETSIIFQNITQKMENIKYNFILKIKYKFLKEKKEKIDKKIKTIKEYFNSSKIEKSNLMKEIYDLNEHIESFIISCYKTIKLYNSFNNLLSSIITLIKLFFFILAIALSFALIFFVIIYYIRYRRRKSYEILKQEITHSSFRNIKDRDLGVIKSKTKK